MIVIGSVTTVASPTMTTTAMAAYPIVRMVLEMAAPLAQILSAHNPIALSYRTATDIATTVGVFVISSNRAMGSPR